MRIATKTLYRHLEEYLDNSELDDDSTINDLFGDLRDKIVADAVNPLPKKTIRSKSAKTVTPDEPPTSQR